MLSIVIAHDGRFELLVVLDVLETIDDRFGGQAMPDRVSAASTVSTVSALDEYAPEPGGGCGGPGP